MRNLSQANVFIEALYDLPPLIEDEVRQILKIESWENQILAAEQEAHAEGAVAWYQAESPRNTMEDIHSHA